MNNSSVRQKERALLSVSDKTGLLDLVSELVKSSIELISTGGTAKILREAGFAVREVSEFTGFSEIMEGRVKTLHPKVHGALLARSGVDDAVIIAHGIQPIDFLVVNLYPFEKAISDSTCTLEEAIENIDVGGPAMIRAAAKNYERVTVVVDPQDYADLIRYLQQQDQGAALQFRRELAMKAFDHTAHYDAMIAQWLQKNFGKNVINHLFPKQLSLEYLQKIKLRYGENPHQQAAFYAEKNPPAGCIASAKLLAGKELSFNNLVDAETALECVKLFSEDTACVIVKHANPCGVALGSTSLEAYERAFAADPVSAFGGIVAFNRYLDIDTANAILERQFVELIIAPEIEKAALNLFRRKPNVRLLECGQWKNTNSISAEFRSISHGLLVQETDRETLSFPDLKVVSDRKPSANEMQDLLFAWRVAMFVKSNAIVYARNRQILGIGAGQTSRVMSAKIANLKALEAGFDTVGAVMASDAFFPFRDGIDAAAEAGISAVIQPGGSLRDKEVIAVANDHNMAMIFTGVRHFRH